MTPSAAIPPVPSETRPSGGCHVPTTLTRRSLLRQHRRRPIAAALPRLVAAQGGPGGPLLVVAANREPRNLNPAIVASNGVFFVASKVIEPLAEVSYDGGRARAAPRDRLGGLAPTAAASRFTLREGVTWHDGQPFTSADVAFSAMQVWKPLQNLGRVVFKHLEAVETPDARTAVFRFAAPTPFQLIRNALPALTAVLPRHLYEGTDIAANPANTQLVGTGPFRFVEHRPGEFYRLERNAAYWDAGPALPRRDRLPGAARPRRRRRRRSRRTRSSSRPSRPCRSPTSSASARCRASASSRSGYEGITYQLTVEINHRRKELADPRVRRAIAHAIDRRLRGRHDLPRLRQAVDRPGPAFRHAVLRAADVPRHALRRRAAPTRCSTRPAIRAAARTARASSCACCRRRGSSETRQFGDYLRQALADVGIDAEIVNNDAAAHISRRSTPTTPSTSPSARRSIATTRRSRPRSSTRAACRPACRSPTSTATTTRRSTTSSRRPRRSVDEAERARLYKRVPAARGRGPAADQRRRVHLHHGRPRQRARTSPTTRAGRFRTGPVIDRTLRPAQRPGPGDCACEAGGHRLSDAPPATWRSGYAADCKSVHTGSIPVVASKARSPRSAVYHREIAACNRLLRRLRCKLIRLFASAADAIPLGARWRLASNGSKPMNPTIHAPAARLALALGLVAGAWLILSASTPALKRLCRPAPHLRRPSRTVSISPRPTRLRSKIRSPTRPSRPIAEREDYEKECGECHGEDLRGGLIGGPPLRGVSFRAEVR